MIARYSAGDMSAQLEFWAEAGGWIQRWTTTRTYDLEEPDFLWLMTREE